MGWDRYLVQFTYIVGQKRFRKFSEEVFEGCGNCVYIEIAKIEVSTLWISVQFSLESIYFQFCPGYAINTLFHRSMKFQISKNLGNEFRDPFTCHVISSAKYIYDSLTRIQKFLERYTKKYKDHVPSLHMRSR